VRGALWGAPFAYGEQVGLTATKRITPWRALPADPAEWFSPDEIAKAKRYQRPLDVVTLVDQGLRLAFGLVLVGTGVPGRVLDGLGVHGWILRLVVLCLLVNAFAAVTMLPAGVWRQLVYDRRWGFSTQTGRGLLVDELKGLLLISALLTAFAIPTWAVVRATSWWWLYGWAIFAVLSAGIGVLYPVLIAPLFNRYSPLPEGELRVQLFDVAALVDADINEILVEDSSKRTTKGNAYVAGLGRTRRVVLYDTMVDRPAPELRTIVAHELGHWKLRHLAKTMPAVIGLSFVTFALLGLVLPNHHVLRFAHISRLGDPVGFLLFILAFPIASKVTGLVQVWMSRSFERQADLFALRSTGDLLSFQSAMRNLYTGNLNDLAPSVWKRLNATHPPAAERLTLGRAWGDIEHPTAAGDATATGLFSTS
jgi:STE24 endopeptidase